MTRREKGFTMGSGTCMVCGSRKVVGIWEDRDGFRLCACGDDECVRGYEPVEIARVRRNIVATFWKGHDDKLATGGEVR